MIKVQSNRQGDSTSNEQTFGKIPSQESHTQHINSGVSFSVIASVFSILYMLIKCSYKLQKNVQKMSKTTNIDFIYISPTVLKLLIRHNIKPLLFYYLQSFKTHGKLY